MDILLNVHHGPESIEESPRALLRIDKAGLLALISMIEQVKALKDQDDSIYAVERWDHKYPVFWFNETGMLDDAGFVKIQCPGHVEIKKRLADKIEKRHDTGYSVNDEGLEIRSECRVMVTSDDSVHWTALVKHTDLVLESSVIPIDALRRYADKA